MKCLFDMKAIQTEYKDILFRSRLESRWAVLFDALNLVWVYEPECFELSNGLKYTPDFYIEKYDIYVEIKPNFDWLKEKYHIERYENFGRQLLVLSGSYPNFNVNALINSLADALLLEVIFCPNSKYEPFFFTGMPLGSEESLFQCDYTKELKKVKQYRFYK